VARPKSFDKDKALENAMHVFWEKGFEATSIQDLVERLGINRQSLYDTFGDKKELFLKSLALYRSQIATNQTVPFQEGQTIQQIFAKIFHAIIDASIHDGRGCLMANSTLELANRDKDVAEVVCNNLETGETAFKQMLIAAQERGELSPEKNPQALARYLFNSMQGIRVTAKASSDRARLEDIASITLSVLD
jgi:TetR/AcrR family transcriptional repressor of nem operon